MPDPVDIVHYQPTPHPGPAIEGLIAAWQNSPDEGLGWEAIGYALRRYRNNPRLNHLLLAYQDDPPQLVGAACLDANPYARQRTLFFLGALQGGQGIGTSLLQAAVSLLPDGSTLACDPLGNSPGFYRHYGFSPTEAGMWVQSPASTSALREAWRQRHTPLQIPSSPSVRAIEL